MGKVMNFREGNIAFLFSLSLMKSLTNGNVTDKRNDT